MSATANNNKSTSEGASSAGRDIGNAIKQGATGVHGIGEAIRGNINSAIDGAFNEKEGVAKNDAIAQKGINEVEDGNYRGYPEQKAKFDA